MNNVIDGELVVRNGPTDEDVAPDVFRFTFEGGEADLCIRCAVTRSIGGTLWIKGMGPRVGGVCEDCGNEG